MVRSNCQPPEGLPSLEDRIQVDVCVVGGGYAGLHSAIELAQRGYRVAVLEARRVGWGASGRNGGQICTAFAADMDKIERWVGREDAVRLFELAEEAKTILCERIERFEIECGLTWGYLQPREMECEEWADTAARDYGYEKLEIVKGAEALRELVDSPRYIGGLIDQGAGHLHPWNYCLGLACGAAALGVQIFENSKVIGIQRGDPVTVRTATGEVVAPFVIVAGNAYLNGIVPELRGRLMPVGTYIGATEPLGEARARSLLPQDHAFADLKFVLDFFRRSPDHRLLFGGRVSYSSCSRRISRPPWTRDAEGFLSSRTYDRAGLGRLVGITMSALPTSAVSVRTSTTRRAFPVRCGADRDCRQVVAEAVAGQAERFDLFARLPHRPSGGPLLRTPTLVLAMLWYRLKDLLP